MAKYLVTKASKISRRIARNAKLASRPDWTRRDDEAPRRKPASGAARRLACIVVALATLPALALASAAPCHARGSGGWSHSDRSATSPHREEERKKDAP